ncbi:MAG: amidohydrolase [Clostridiales bacterium]|nr:amidohydrolase [Clostridiales bacterium]
MKILIDNASVVINNDGIYSIKTKSIVIEDKYIKEVEDTVSDDEFDLVIDGRNKLVIPGLVNAHNHSYMTLFRNSADDLPFDKWLFEKIIPQEDQLSGDNVYWGSMLGIMEMIYTGTTCFADMYMFVNETSRAVEESGIRANLSRGLVDIDGGGDRRLDEALSEIKDYEKRDNERIKFSLAPHAPYTCSKDYLEKVISKAHQLNLGINTHLSETRKEVNDIQDQFKVTPTGYLNQLGLFDQRTLAAHCVYLTEEDMDILYQKKVNVASNPTSNLKLGNGVAPVKYLVNKGINVCLGTDGAASNNTLNIFKEMQMISLIHKGVHEDAELITAQEALYFATSAGAKALGFKRLGEVKAGYLADLSIIDLDKPQYYPRNNLIAALVYSTTGEEVETVIVDGKVLMHKKIFKTIDVERVKYEVTKINNRLKRGI